MILQGQNVTTPMNTGDYLIFCLSWLLIKYQCLLFCLEIPWLALRQTTHVPLVTTY